MQHHITLCAHHRVDTRCIADLGPTLQQQSLPSTAGLELAMQCMESTASLVFKLAARKPAVAGCSCMPRVQDLAGPSGLKAKGMDGRQPKDLGEPGVELRWHCKLCSMLASKVVKLSEPKLLSP